MLHEIFLSLSGYPSPLLEPELAQGRTEALDQLSTSEKQLLANLGTLSQLHRRLRNHLDRILAEHQSVVCRAAASSLRRTHLARFQRKILDVESNVLRKDSLTVGAYNIVPLAYVVGQFDDWHRRMQWYWSLVTFIFPLDYTSSPCTSAALIDRLRHDARTGYLDVEEAATELSVVAERAWLRQLSALISGNISSTGDFFVQVERDENGVKFRRIRSLIPKFVTDATASSILFITKSWDHIQQHQASMVSGFLAGGRRSQLVNEHLSLLMDIATPIQSAELSNAITTIRLSLSQNILQKLLPAQLTRTILSCLRRYFLLSQSDFASILLREAEHRAESCWQNMDRLAGQDLLKALNGLQVKDTEVNQVFRKALSSMATTAIDDDLHDFAGKHLTLATVKRVGSRPSTSDSFAEERVKPSPIVFNDLLFSTPTSLQLQLKSPINLLLSDTDISIYSNINAYLLSLRRAQLRIEDLWRRNTFRRRSITTSSTAIVSRKSWAVCSNTLHFFSEFAAYLETDVVAPSFQHFEAWACEVSSGSSEKQDGVLKDPETLAAGHRGFLDSLAYDILVTETAYTKALRSLLGSVDQLTSLFVRFMDHLDKETSASIMDALPDKDFAKIKSDLNKACQRTENDCRTTIDRLQQLHQDRVGSSRHLEMPGRDIGGYQPYKAGGLDHLLVKLQHVQRLEDNHE